MMKALVALFLLLLGQGASGETLLVHGEIIHTMAGDAIRDGYVLIKDGRIAAIGRSSDYEPDGTETVLKSTVVTPGIVDARTCVGLAGHLNIPHDQDELDRGAPLQPHLRAIDAYNPHERLVEWVRGFGVTTVHTGHAPEALVSGQTMIVKTTGNRVDDITLKPVAMISCSMSDTAIHENNPGTRAKASALLRQKLLDTRHYIDKKNKPAKIDEDGEDKDSKSQRRNLELESLASVLSGETPLLIHAHKARDIANALRLREEFNIPIVLDGASESYMLIEEIKDADVPVFIHPTMIRPYGERENLSFETASKLIDAGIPVAMQSGYESYVPRTRVVLYEAGMAAANGCDFDDALAMITITPAKILGVDDRVGSLEVGKDGDLAMYDGDPFEWTTHCTGVVIDGEIVANTPR